MTLKLAAEDFTKCYGILVLDDDNLIEINSSNIPQKLLLKLKKWYSNYYKFTGMSLEELALFESEINFLDEIGLELLKDISKLDMFKNVKRFIYYSRGKDKVLLELNYC